MTKNIWKYLQGERVGKEANRLEKEALSDPFLYEALEGFTSVEREHRQIIADLQDQVKKRTVRRQNFGMYGWAAAVVLLIGGVALWLFQEPQQESQMAVIQERIDSLSVGFEMLAAPERNSNTIPDSLVQNKYSAAAAKNHGSRHAMQWTAADVSVTEKKMTVTDSDRILLQTDTVISRKMEIRGHGKVKPEKDNNETVLQGIGLLRVRKAGNVIQDSSNTEIAGVDKAVLVKNVRTKRASKSRELSAGSVIRRREDTNKNTFTQYVTDSLRYPEDAHSLQIEGEVILYLHFDRKGRLGSIKVIQKLFPSCDREAVRLVRQYPGSWDIKKGDTTVRVRFVLKNKD